MDVYLLCPCFANDISLMSYQRSKKKSIVVFSLYFISRTFKNFTIEVCMGGVDLTDSRLLRE